MSNQYQFDEASNLITAKETLKRVQRSKSWLYKQLSNGAFPKPVKIGARAISFIESEVNLWIKEQITLSRGCSDERH